MLIVIVRTLILYALVVVAMRLMGKQQIGQLQPFELVITLMISELASIPMENTGVPLMNGITPILTLIFAQVLLSYISLKSDRARAIICGRPSVLIENGKIIEAELKKMRYNLSDLLEQLRAKDLPNVADVEFAILETNGNLSVIPKSDRRPVTPEDLRLSVQKEGPAYTLITDGRIVERNLSKSSYDLKWLEMKLQELGILSHKDVLLATVDSQGKFYCQKKDSRNGG